MLCLNPWYAKENNSFFAYQPILAALQAASGRVLPLASFLAPEPLPAPPTNLPQTLAQPLPTANVEVDQPAYLSESPYLDLTVLCDADVMGRMTKEERDR